MKLKQAIIVRTDLGMGKGKIAGQVAAVAQKTWAFAGGVSPGQPIEFMSNMTHFKGNITFYWDQVRIKDTHGLDPTYTSNPGWDIGDGGKNSARWNYTNDTFRWK
jgi:hypothetical protein